MPFTCRVCDDGVAAVGRALEQRIEAVDEVEMQDHAILQGGLEDLV